MSQFGLSFVTIWVLSQFYYFSCHNLSFVTIWALSQFEFLSYVTIWAFELCHNLSFWVVSTFEFLSFVAIWVLELSKFEFLSFVKIWVKVVTIRVFKLSKFNFFCCCQNLIFWVLSKIDFLSCHNLGFQVLSQFDFLSFATRAWMFGQSLNDNSLLNYSFQIFRIFFPSQTVFFVSINLSEKIARSKKAAMQTSHLFQRVRLRLLSSWP